MKEEHFKKYISYEGAMEKAAQYLAAHHLIPPDPPGSPSLPDAYYRDLGMLHEIIKHILNSK